MEMEMEKKLHLTWWDRNLPIKTDEFSSWLSDSDRTSRENLFNFIKENNISSVLECGPGTFIDYNNFFINNKNIKYSAIDITNSIVESGKLNNIDIDISSIEEINKDNDSYELVYCRHVLEHQDSFEKSLTEMIRVSNKYVVAILWLLSDSEDSIISYDNNENLYHNNYSREKINSFLTERNLKFEWKMVENDKILIIRK